MTNYKGFTDADAFMFFLSVAVLVAIIGGAVTKAWTFKDEDKQ